MAIVPKQYVKKRSMRLIMLAARQGLRMGRITHVLSKALLPIIDGLSIASINIARLAASGAVTDLVVVGGHCWETINRFSRTTQSPLPIASVFNKEFAIAGAARSIAVALDYAGTSGLEAVTVHAWPGLGRSLHSLNLVNRATFRS